jgi:hypothetical protein
MHRYLCAVGGALGTPERRLVEGVGSRSAIGLRGGYVRSRRHGGTTAKPAWSRKAPASNASLSPRTSCNTGAARSSTAASSCRRGALLQSAVTQASGYGSMRCSGARAEIQASRLVLGGPAAKHHLLADDASRLPSRWCRSPLGTDDSYPG